MFADATDVPVQIIESRDVEVEEAFDAGIEGEEEALGEVDAVLRPKGRLGKGRLGKGRRGKGKFGKGRRGKFGKGRTLFENGEESVDAVEGEVLEKREVEVEPLESVDEGVDESVEEGVEAVMRPKGRLGKGRRGKGRRGKGKFGKGRRGKGKLLVEDGQESVEIVEGEVLEKREVEAEPLESVEESVDEGIDAVMRPKGRLGKGRRKGRMGKMGKGKFGKGKFGKGKTFFENGEEVEVLEKREVEAEPLESVEESVDEGVDAVMRPKGRLGKGRRKGRMGKMGKGKFGKGKFGKGKLLAENGEEEVAIVEA